MYVHVCMAILLAQWLGCLGLGSSLVGTMSQVSCTFVRVTPYLCRIGVQAECC
jgi:hypothetical protein